MKKTILVFAFVVVNWMLNAQNVVIPDANFKAYLIAKPEINTNNDDEIQISEANSYVGDISLRFRQITDLTGIEAFVSLTHLNCSDNQLTELDVSSNTALTILECTRNQLTELDISLNVNLITLRCNTNQLTELNTTNNPNLTELICSRNRINEVNLQQNTALRIVDFYTNQLTELDVTNNNVIRILSCGDNQLTSLEVSNITTLTNLSCRDNSIVELDLSSNSALRILYSQNNQLVSLNVANGINPSFTQFNATNNPNLNCIKVDDIDLFYFTHWNKDDNTGFHTDCSVAGVNQLTIEENLHVYPNPVEDQLYIDLKAPIIKASIWSLEGKKIIEQRTNNIDTTNLKPGIYLLQVLMENNSFTKKIIKK